MDVLTAMKRSRMTMYQYIAIAVCLIIVTVDGFDVFVMGIVLPYLPDAFVADPAQQGFVLSAAIFGMAAGAILLAPLGDRIGRRKLVIGSTALCAVGMAGSALAVDAVSLGLTRVLTGLGVGAMASSIAVLVQEFTSERRRTVVFGVYSIGFPLGSVLCGWAAVILFGGFGLPWQAIFVTGAVLTLLALVLAVVVLPESVDYLVARNPRGAQEQLQQVVTRMGLTGVDLSLRPAAVQPERSTLAGLFAHGTWRRTLLLWSIYSGLMIAYYFASTWTPQLVTSATGDLAAGTNAGLMLSIGGFVGALGFALVSLRFRAAPVVMVSMLLAGASVLGLSAAFSLPTTALLLTGLVGTFTYVAITAVTTLIIPLYLAQSRATAAGWMVGVGRLFSIIAPIAVGYLVVVISPAALYALSAVPLLLGAVATYPVWRLLGRQEKEAAAAFDSPAEPVTLPAKSPAS